MAGRAAPGQGLTVYRHLLHEFHEARLGADGIEDSIPTDPRHHLRIGREGPVELARTSFYLGRETILPSGSGKMAQWRKRLFGLMSRNAEQATSFFGLPPNRVVELGAEIEL